MIKRLSINLILVLVLNFSFAQSYIKYFNLANQAEIHIQEGKYHIAQNTIITIFNEYKVLKPKEQFYLGITYYFNNDSANGRKNIENSIKGFLVSKKARDYFFNLLDSSLIPNSVIKKFESLEKRTIMQIDSARNSSYNDSIIFYLNLDQDNRLNQSRINAEIDYKLQKEFLGFIKRNGIPNGYLYGDTYFIILIHIFDFQLFNEYQEYLFNQLEKGNLCPNTYAIFIDRRLHSESNGNHTKYNSYQNTTNVNNFEIENNRLEIGLNLKCYLCNCFELYKNGYTNY